MKNRVPTFPAIGNHSADESHANLQELRGLAPRSFSGDDVN